MKPKGRFRGKQQQKKLQQMMVSVESFVKSRGGQEEEDSDRFERMGNLMKRKSRKDLRREKRRNKKLRNQRNPAAQTQSSEGSAAAQTQTNNKSILKTKAGSDDGAGGKNRVQFRDPETKKKPEKSPKEKPKRKVHFDDAASQETKKAKLNIARRKALLEANEAEDKEIKKLEKRLHLNKRKNKRTLPQSFIDDGLDYILGILEPGGCGALLEDEDDEGGLERLKEISDSEEEEEEGERDAGREKDLEGVTEEVDEGNEDEDEEDGGGDDDGIEEEVDDDDDDDDDEEVEEEGGDDDDEEEEEEEVEGVPENEQEEEEEEEEEESEKSTNSEQPSTSTVGKYVPPQLREAADSKRKAELQRLKRSLKGLINRLSEANMASISGQVEEMYMSCSRKDMNDTLTDLLLAACVTPTLMPDRLLMEHVLVLSVLHHTVGLEVGAHFLETVVRRFDEMYRQGSEEGKECDNLLSIVAHLYNFHVVHALLLFDVLKRLLGSFSARDVELVLLLLRNVGFALRKDDPLALKELITEAQRKASAEGQRFSDQTRVRFMLETMLALKNNDMRKIPGYDPEPVERLRKLQRTLIHNRASGTDVKLRVSLENLLEAERVGRWWIVGSSWSGAPMISENNENKTTSQPAKGEQFSAKVLDLARKQRMNTDIRRNIFCVIMTSEDYMDAFEKLLRLGLKGQQERDIVHVLLDCCLQEKSFNGFYAVLAEKFCSHDRRFQMTFQFSLWDKFKELASLSSSSFTNLVQMVIHLLHKNSLSLSILKAIEFGELDKPNVKFLRQILSKLLQQTQPEDLVQMFGRISGIPKLGMLREGLKLFIRHFLLRSSQTQGSAEQNTQLTERAEIAIKAMEARDSQLKL
uniref:Nucleolar MIF4G domain-containing protein 1 n=1 Tax=Astyanax mexicanus TaxID=7994 RepID=A0A3B1KA21_ASTMX